MSFRKRPSRWPRPPAGAIDGRAAPVSPALPSRHWAASARGVAVALAALLAVRAPATAQEKPRPARIPLPGATELTISTGEGRSALLLEASKGWGRPMPAVTRAVIVVHGRNRNAQDYFVDLAEAAARAGLSGPETLLLAPQFLRGSDVDALGLGANTLAWPGNSWMDNGTAERGAALGSFDALDALLARLGDHALFPNLSSITVAGHAGGAQLVQRYAVVSDAPDALKKAGIDTRFAVADPSSYAYFDDRRPAGPHRFEPANTAACPKVNRWKYGLDGAPATASNLSPEALETRYASRAVTYLLARTEGDPADLALDANCAAQAQGPDRLSRGRSYFDYLSSRHPQGLNQRLLEADGIGHNGGGLLVSDCGLAALFDRPGCAPGR